MDERLTEDKNWRGDLTKKENATIETSLPAPFPFDFIEKNLRKKTFGILTTITPEGRPHSVGVVYAMPPDLPFCLYLITRPVLKRQET